MELLTDVILDVPEGSLGATVEKMKKAEAARAAELAAQGHLLRLLQGAALLAPTFDDPEFVTGEAALLKNWIQAL
jgi:muconolactone delta-isomerase